MKNWWKKNKGGTDPTSSELTELKKDAQRIKIDDPDLANEMEDFIKNEYAKVNAAKAAAKKSQDAAEWTTIETKSLQYINNIEKIYKSIDLITNADPAINSNIQSLKDTSKQINIDVMLISDEIVKLKNTNNISDANAKLAEMKTKEDDIKNLLSRANVLNITKGTGSTDPNVVSIIQNMDDYINNTIKPTVITIKGLNKVQVDLKTQIDIAETALSKCQQIYNDKIKISNDLADIKLQVKLIQLQEDIINNALLAANKLPDIPFNDKLKIYKDQLTDFYKNKQSSYNEIYRISDTEYKDFMNNTDLAKLEKNISTYFEKKCIKH